MTRRKLWEALAAGAMTFLTGIAVYHSFHELNATSLFQPTVQAAILVVSVLAGRLIPEK